MKKYKLLQYIFTIAAMLLFIGCTNNNDKRLHKELVRRATDLNQSAPYALDEYTRFDSVGVSADNVYRYYYTITNTDNPHKLMAFQKEDIVEMMDKMYATDRSLQFFVMNNVSMEYIYRDTMQNVVETIIIDTKKYRGNMQQH